MSPARHSRRAVTLIDILVLFIVVVVIGAICMPLMSTTRCCGCRRMRDSTDLRGISQALVVWAQSNNGSYPLPSQLDASNATIDEPASTKDTTGNILSIMIYNGSIAPEMLVSSAEVNPAIQRHDSYVYEAPALAARPENALWDPTFRGTPVDAPTYAAIGGAGNQSFAHVLPFGRRSALWHDTYNSTEPIFANRGPAYAPDDAAPASAAWALTNDQFGTGSNTLLIHGGRNTWEGNVVFNDNHVEFINTPTPQQVTLQATARDPRSGTFRTAPAADNIFVNETNEPGGDGSTGRVDQGTNAYLRPIADVLERARPRVWRD